MTGAVGLILLVGLPYWMGRIVLSVFVDSKRIEEEMKRDLDTLPSRSSLLGLV